LFLAGTAEARAAKPARAAKVVFIFDNKMVP